MPAYVIPPQSANPDRDALLYLQQRFGTTNYNSWQSLRWSFYSYVKYPEAGGASFSFFGNPTGGTSVDTLQLTNIPKANSFGQQHFLLKTIKSKIFIQTDNFAAYDGTDASTLYSDYLMGLVQAGVLTLKINSRDYLQIPKPFLYAPTADGSQEYYGAGVASATLNEAAPNTLATFVSPYPRATQAQKDRGLYEVDPNLLIEAEQNFQCQLTFDSGLVPVIGTGVTDDTTNPLYIGVEFDGIVFRPTQ